MARLARREVTLLLACLPASCFTYALTTNSFALGTSSSIAPSPAATTACVKIVDTLPAVIFNSSTIPASHFTYCECGNGTTVQASTVTRPTGTFVVCETSPTTTIDGWNATGVNETGAFNSSDSLPNAFTLPAIPACNDSSTIDGACFHKLNLSTFKGDLLFAPDSQCSSQQRLQLRQGLEWARRIAIYSYGFPFMSLEPHDDYGRGHSAMRYWFGPDSWRNQYMGRVRRNVIEAALIHKNEGIEQWIVMHCNDPHNLCGRKDHPDGSVGGYAWSVLEDNSNPDDAGSWTYHISMCDIYYTTTSFDDTTKWVREHLKIGRQDHLSLARWYQNQGTMFLHEIFHLRFVWHSPVSGPDSPHIIDQPIRDCESPNVECPKNPRKAYKPEGVFELAQNPIKKGGGCRRSTINADSYAWALTSMYFWDFNKREGDQDVFPGVAGKDVYAAELTVDDDILNTTGLPEIPAMLYLGDMTNATANSSMWRSAYIEAISGLW